MYFMLDSMIRYDQINATFQKWYSEDARNFESFVQTSDLLRVFRSVSFIQFTDFLCSESNIVWSSMLLDNKDTY